MTSAFPQKPQAGKMLPGGGTLFGQQHPAPTPTPTVPKTPPLSSSQQNVYDLMAQTLASWGLSSLAPDLKTLVAGGDTSPDTLSLALSQTAAFKQRFSGNEARKKAGLPELNPAQYIALEEGYRSVLNAYGLPAQYGSHDFMADMIGKDISAAEVSARAQVAHDQYTAAPSYVKDLWQKYYGGKGDAIAAILDPTTATQIIQDRSQQVGIGGAAAQYGMGIGRRPEGVPEHRRQQGRRPVDCSPVRYDLRPDNRRERRPTRRCRRRAEASDALRLGASTVPREGCVHRL
jgi:hypothetical protein